MTKAKKKLLMLITVFFVFFIVFQVVKSTQSKVPKKKEAAVTARSVQTAVAQQQDVPIYIESFGNLTSVGDVDIRSRVTGEIEEVHFSEGQAVKKGDLLFTIDPKPFQAELDKAEAILAADTADLNLKKDLLERNKKLYDSQLISEQDYVKYQADLEAAQAKIKVDQSQIELAKLNLGYCSVVSPIDGITGKRQIDPGNIISANTGPVLVNIKAVDSLYVDFSLSESDLQRVRSAMSGEKLKVNIEPRGAESHIFSGEIGLIENVVDTATGTISLRGTVPNPEKKLWAGQFINVELILGEEKNAVLVPYAAVQLGQQGEFVFVVKPDNTVELRSITSGERHGDDMVIKNGVAPGEKVVTSGQLGLAPGMLIKEVKQQ